ncbi:coagulation factor V isoform X4 [Etheostoma cragini]|uniref:coagulation factor V isoform X4 n=1 Tax=Etheostoma cragini TaxID=417921 RepID=UPI00155DDFC6|nr:coagulation factor V isoform X4 [Etheostoma cragini]
MRLCVRAAGAWRLLPVLVLLTVLHVKADPQQPKERHYYIAAVEIDWDYAGNDTHRSGPTYKKVVFREYDDKDFRQPKPHPSWLGLLGPTLRAQEGETIVVTFRNLATAPHSIHPHGIAYGKQSEGANYFDNTSQKEKEDDIVRPNSQHVYYWEVTKEVSPQPSDPSCLTYTYISHKNVVEDYNSGLIGALLICKPGTLDESGKQVGVYHEYVFLFGVFDENESKYKPKGHANHVKYTINGYTMGSLPDVSMCAYASVSLHLVGMSSEPEVFSVHMNGQVLQQTGHKVSSVGLISGSSATASMVALHTGRWLLSSHTIKHMEAGMHGFVDVKKCDNFQAPQRKMTIEQKRQSREWTYYIAAEEIIWDYAPNMPEHIDEDFTLQYLRQSPTRIGGKYKKAVYTLFNNESFTERLESKQRKNELGILGPVIKAQIRDVIKIVFKNMASRPYSIYPHGLTIEKSDEGVNYPAGGNQSHGVQPGETHTYIWRVVDEDQPLEGDSRCLTRLYHSAVDTPRDIASGLIGQILICKSRSLNIRGVQLKADKEQHAMLAVFDENKSWYLDENIRQYCDRSKVNKADPDFYKSNVMHSINGYVFESGPLLGFCNGEIATWHVSSIGAQDYIQTATFYGHTFEVNGRTEDFLSLYPMTGETITMNMDNIGVWLMASLNSHETTKAMRVKFQDVECFRDNLYEYSDESMDFNAWNPKSKDEIKKDEEKPKTVIVTPAEPDIYTDLFADELGLRSMKNQSRASSLEQLDLSFLDYDAVDVPDRDPNITLNSKEMKKKSETSIPKPSTLNETLISNREEVDELNHTAVNLLNKSMSENTTHVQNSSVPSAFDNSLVYKTENTTLLYSPNKLLNNDSITTESSAFVSNLINVSVSGNTTVHIATVLSMVQNVSAEITNHTAVLKETTNLSAALRGDSSSILDTEKVHVTLTGDNLTSVGMVLAEDFEERLTRGDVFSYSVPQSNSSLNNLHSTPEKNATSMPHSLKKEDENNTAANQVNVSADGTNSPLSIPKAHVEEVNIIISDLEVEATDNTTSYNDSLITPAKPSIPMADVVKVSISSTERSNLTILDLEVEATDNTTSDNDSLITTAKPSIPMADVVKVSISSTERSNLTILDLEVEATDNTTSDNDSLITTAEPSTPMADVVKVSISSTKISNLTILELEVTTKDKETIDNDSLIKAAEPSVPMADVEEVNIIIIEKSNLTILDLEVEAKDNTTSDNDSLITTAQPSIPTADDVEVSISSTERSNLTIFELEVDSDNDSLVTTVDPEYGLQMNSTESVPISANSSLKDVTQVLLGTGPLQNMTEKTLRSNLSKEISSEIWENVTALPGELNHTAPAERLSNETELYVWSDAVRKNNSGGAVDSIEEVLIYLTENKTHVMKTTNVKMQEHNWTYEETHQMELMEIPDYMMKYFGKETPKTTPPPKKTKKVNLRQRPQKGQGMKTKRRKEYKPQAVSGLPFSPRGFNPGVTPRGARPLLTQPLSDEEELINKPVVIGVPRPDFSDYELYVPGDDPDHLGLEENVKADEYEYVTYKDPYKGDEDIKNLNLDDTTKYYLKLSGPNVKTYFLSAEEVEWDYAGYGQRRQDESQPNSRETKFTKVVFRGYMDSSFSTPDVRGEIDEHLGILGPVIKAEVGQSIMVVFRNKANRPYSLHPNGVSYTKQTEGLSYEDGSKYWYKYDNEVQPNTTFTYLWKVNSMVGPMADESHCRTWAYYSGVNPERDIHSGLIGPLLVCREGTLNRESTDMREFTLLFMTFDESQSWYYKENHEMMQRKSRRRFMETNSNENLKFHSINGITYNLKGLRMYTKQLVCWYLINMGSPKDFQSVHFHGQTFLHKKTTSYRQAVYPLLPGSFATLEMFPSKPGLWQLETEVGFNQQKGMQTLFLVLDNECYRPLGLESGSVKDSQITAINTRGNWKPHLARLNNPGKFNAWSTEQNKSWIQVDFQRPVVISQVATQGAKQMFLSQYVVKYSISYSTDRQKWIFYKGDSRDLRKVFPGNQDAHTEKKNILFPPVVGRFIRLHPINWYGKATVRMELFGCELDGCSVPLGMESRLIKDHQITASSTASSWYSGPWKPSLARLNTQGTINAWQAKHGDMNQWLQVELPTIKKITGIMTQGAKSLGKEMYVMSYALQYSNNGIHWNQYTDDESVPFKTFLGNTSNNDPVKNYIYPPIFSRFIRIIPISWMNSITMRIELLGCDFE